MARLSGTDARNALAQLYESSRLYITLSEFRSRTKLAARTVSELPNSRRARQVFTFNPVSRSTAPQTPPPRQRDKAGEQVMLAEYFSEEDRHA